MRTTFDTSSAKGYPPKRDPGLNRAALRLAAVAFVVALLLLALDGTGLLRPVKGYIQAVLRPTEQALTQVRSATRTRLELILGTAELQGRVSDLEQEVSRLREENIHLQGLQSENNRLKIELGVRQTYDWITKSATVVQANAENGRRIVRIDRGRIDGIKLGMAVVGKEGGSPAALVGIVDALYAQTADVLLITDYGSAISAHTTQQVPAKGMIYGQWQIGSRIKLADVDPAVLLEHGDYVVTAGLSKGVAADTPLAQVPANIPIGTVMSVDRTNHVQSAEVQPFVDGDRVREVWVIVDQK